MSKLILALSAAALVSSVPAAAHTFTQDGEILVRGSPAPIEDVVVTTPIENQVEHRQTPHCNRIEEMLLQDLEALERQRMQEQAILDAKLRRSKSFDLRLKRLDLANRKLDLEMRKLYLRDYLETRCRVLFLD